MNKQENKHRSLIIIIALIFIVLFKYVPAPSGMSVSAMQVLGIFIGVLILWLTLAIDWPSMLCLAALAFVPELKFSTILSGSIGGSTFSFLLFTFMCTYAISKTPFIRRCALFFVNSKLAQRGPWSFAIAFFASTLILGSFMSPTVLFIIYLPIIEEIYTVLGLKKTDKFANMLMIGMTLGIAISSGMTPIAHVFSIMAMGFYQAATNLTINYFQYMLFGIPVGLITFSGVIILFKFVLRPDVSVFYHNKESHLHDDTAKMDKKEKIILTIFSVVVLLWITPGLLEYVLPNIATYINSFGNALPPLLGATLLMMITINGKPLLSFNEAMTKGISWPALIMTASTLALGSALTNSDIGLTSWLSTFINTNLGDLSPMLMVLIFTLWAAVQTNLSSNMVTITVVCAIALPITIASNGLISSPAIASIIGLMGAFAFATPPAHPNVAIAGSSGWTSAKQLMIYGFMTMMIAVIVTTFIGYPLAVALMGF